MDSKLIQIDRCCARRIERVDVGVLYFTTPVSVCKSIEAGEYR